MANEIKITQGDAASVNLNVQDGSGTAVDITGASFSTTIKGADGTDKTFGNSQHTIVDALNGQVQLALSAADTASLQTGEEKEIVMKITIGATIIHYRGVHSLAVLQAAPRY